MPRTCRVPNKPCRSLHPRNAKTAEVRVENHSIVNRPRSESERLTCRNAPPSCLVMSSSLGAVQAVEMPYALAVFRILTVSAIDLVVVDDRRADISCESLATRNPLGWLSNSQSSFRWLHRNRRSQPSP